MDFKRINFFKGFFTQAEDWQAAERYHIEKRKLHNTCLHTPGIVAGHLDSLAVMASPDGTSLYIGPGCAIDGFGRELSLSEPETIRIIPQDYNLPATVYVVIRYNEEKIDRRENVANPEYSDYAFIRESPQVEVTTEEPDNRESIELARIELSRREAKIQNARDPDKPDSHEIDCRYIQRAGTVREPVRLQDIGVIIKEGEIRVAASREDTPSENDPNVLIESIQEGERHRFYLVSAYPTAEARVNWRIETSFKSGGVEYRLFFKNFSTRAVAVSYRVYKLD